MIKTRIALTLAPLAAAIAFTPAAFAADTSLSWSDLDLRTEAGQTQLDARIDQAAQTVCANQTITGTRVRRGASRDCLIAARSQIKTQVAARIARTEAKTAHASPKNAGQDKPGASAIAIR